jgi:hypothetical protein
VKVFSPALRAALTSVTGALFFVEPLLSREARGELAALLPVFRDIGACAESLELGSLPKVLSNRHR